MPLSLYILTLISVLTSGKGIWFTLLREVSREFRVSLAFPINRILSGGLPVNEGGKKAGVIGSKAVSMAILHGNLCFRMKGV